jgi:hypothetical protein
LFKVFSDQQHFKFNGFEKNDQHKHKLSILFGDSLYYGASKNHPSGMRSDAMVIDTSEHIVDLYKNDPVVSGLRSDAMVDTPDKRVERDQRESVSSGTRSDFFANAQKRKVEFDLNHSTKKKITDDDGSASVQKKSQIQDQLLMDILEKGKSLQRIENFENEKQYIDCLFNLTHEDYFKPVRDAILLLRNGKFNEIEYCKFFDKALVYKAEKIYLEEDELTRTKKIDTRADFDIRTNGFYIKMECKNNWRLPRKCQNGLEVYLSNDRFVTNCFLARISELTEDVVSLKLDHKDYDSLKKINHRDEFSVLIPPGLEVVYSSVLASLKTLRDQSVPLKDIIGELYFKKFLHFSVCV